jgi:hypothetical protein
MSMAAMFGAAAGAVPAIYKAPPSLPGRTVPVVPASRERMSVRGAGKSAAEMGYRSKPGYGWSKGPAAPKLRPANGRY